MKPQTNTLNDMGQRVPQSQFVQALILALLLHGIAILYIDIIPIPKPHTIPILMVKLTPLKHSQGERHAHSLPVSLSAPPPANQEPSALEHTSTTTALTAYNSQAVDQKTHRPQVLQAPRNSKLTAATVAANLVPQSEPPRSHQTKLVSTGKSLSNVNAAAFDPAPEVESAAKSTFNVYARHPRRKVISADTTDSRYTSYLETWRRRVELIGNLNYPEVARHNKWHGDVILQVTLRANGSVQNMLVVQSSGYQALDDAAIHIVQLAGPFAPFPIEIRQEADILDITRTWQFLSGNHIN